MHTADAMPAYMHGRKVLTCVTAHLNTSAFRHVTNACTDLATRQPELQKDEGAAYSSEAVHTRSNLSSRCEASRYSSSSLPECSACHRWPYTNALVRSAECAVSYSTSTQNAVASTTAGQHWCTEARQRGQGIGEARHRISPLR